MILSDLSVKRPVFASVISLMLIALGVVSFQLIPLREYPDIDPPVVSIDTTYPGAAASVVETRITQVIEDRIAGVEGIRFISSSSSDGRSRISVEFSTGRDIDNAANDIRDRISGLLDDLPDEADAPSIEKADSSDDVIIWLSLTSDEMSGLELTDYANRYLVDRLSVLPGVARVRVGGGLEYSMRIWLDRDKLAARQLTVTDVEDALRAENVELPAGGIESVSRQFTARIERGYQDEEDFRQLVVARGESGYLVRLGDVARVEKAAVEDRTMFRGNGRPRVGIGIIKQSTGNTIEVAEAAIRATEEINPTLPDGMSLLPAFDTSVFIRNAIREVYNTLAVAIFLVVLVIWLFLGNVRAMLIPAVTIPVALVGTFIVLLIMNFTINLLTLLALVLAIGLVVDDAIVVLENVSRRIEAGETPLVAAFHGSRQVGFAVVATSVVLIAVFTPIAFLEGDLGRLFSEFALTMAAAVFFSTLVALSLSSMLASKLLTRTEKNRFSRRIDRDFERLRGVYQRVLRFNLRAPWIISLVFVGMLGLAAALFSVIPREYAPSEDRGAFFVLVNGPEGASYEYIKEYMDIVEERMTRFVEAGEIQSLIVRAPRSFGAIASFNDGIVIAVLEPWEDRRSAWDIMADVRRDLADLTGVRAFPVMRQGFGGGIQKPVQFVIGGGTYEELAEWRDILMDKIREDNPGFEGLESDFQETKPQISIRILRDRAAALGVSVRDVGRTLESMLGGRRVTTFIDDGEEYDVIIEGERDAQRTPTNLENIQVRADSGRLIPLSNLVELSELADAASLNRYNRVRAITLESNLEPGYSLGEALTHLENLTREHLPDTVMIDYKGQSLDFQTSGTSILFVFGLGLFVVFLVLAAQFESWMQPLIIMLTVPLAMTGAMVGLFFSGGSLNIYTQVGLIMLVGLAAKNGILIVEFINQLRDEGRDFDESVLEGASIRLRPIVMTGITTAAGSLPLIFTSGAGAETRSAIGIVIFSGVLATTFFTIFVVPVAYALLSRKTGSPGDVARNLAEQEEIFMLKETGE
ncbi:MAG: efflux RND transporter permease subunit [Verrucomicrobia bacterium]|nr:efflux RND transporter permease subunit [Verrucomicrobiota bacterium]MCH8528321.1 efflux RND transporter permease subunit [Kiritimatiellia bacterium]